MWTFWDKTHCCRLFSSIPLARRKFISWTCISDIVEFLNEIEKRFWAYEATILKFRFYSTLWEMSNFAAFILYIVIVYSSYSHQLGEKVTCYTMMPDTAAQTIRYSKEDLLNLRFSAQRTGKYDWSHIYSILPSPTDDHYSRRIETIISSRLL